MNRNMKLFLGLADQLIKTLDAQTELFIKERPFLIDEKAEPKVTEYPLERKDLQEKQEAIVKNLSKI